MSDEKPIDERMPELRKALDEYESTCISTPEGSLAYDAFENAFQTTTIRAMLDEITRLMKPCGVECGSDEGAGCVMCERHGLCHMCIEEEHGRKKDKLLAEVARLKQFEPPVCEQCGEYKEYTECLSGDYAWMCGECE